MDYEKRRQPSCYTPQAIRATPETRDPRTPKLSARSLILRAKREAIRENSTVK